MEDKRCPNCKRLLLKMESSAKVAGATLPHVMTAPSSRDVLFMSNGLQVQRVYAGRVSTKMVEFQSSRDGSVNKFVPNLVSNDRSPTDIENSVPVHIFTSRPFPTLVYLGKILYKAQPQLFLLANRFVASIPVTVLTHVMGSAKTDVFNRLLARRDFA
tara:strand:- start:180 stop:653 length:474 start_codon:yes stop_codon:yes gene_type:complete